MSFLMRASTRLSDRYTMVLGLRAQDTKTDGLAWRG
jgi:hypothetical protein